MKLSARIDLAPHRATALARVDALFAQRVPREALDDLRGAKLVYAAAALKGEDIHPALVHEAELRGITPGEMCTLIVARSTEASNALLALETERQSAKAAIMAASDHHKILKLVADIEGQS